MQQNIAKKAHQDDNDIENMSPLAYRCISQYGGVNHSMNNLILTSWYTHIYIYIGERVCVRKREREITQINKKLEPLDSSNENDWEALNCDDIGICMVNVHNHVNKYILEVEKAPLNRSSLFLFSFFCFLKHHRPSSLVPFAENKSFL